MNSTTISKHPQTPSGPSDTQNVYPFPSSQTISPKTINYRNKPGNLGGLVGKTL